MREVNRVLDEAYRHCRKIALGHYENFPVGSILLPARLRMHFFALYAFMRTADDFADFPDRAPTERLQLLDEWRSNLHTIFADPIPKNSIFLALQNTARIFHLTQEPFDLLLDAFEFDARGDVTFETYADLAWYTERSAEPVGQLVLALFGYRDVQRIAWSNSICSALQIINFLQDAKEDLHAGRYYFPRQAYRKCGIETGADILISDRASELILRECDRIEEMLQTGVPLVGSVRSRLKLELQAVVAGAWAMLRKIREMHGDTIKSRPRLSTWEKSGILLQSLFLRSPRGV